MQTELIIKAAKKGDKEAFDLLVKKYHNELYYTALSIVRSGWDALDICQDTFLKVFSSFDTLKDISKFRAWINRILINKCNDHFRKNKKLTFVDYIESEGFIESGSDENMDLLKSLSNLKDDARVVLTLRYFQDLTLKEIAEILDIPEGTVKSRISNGLKELRRLMGANKRKEGNT